VITTTTTDTAPIDEKAPAPKRVGASGLASA
jgi:hypothetical protein